MLVVAAAAGKGLGEKSVSRLAVLPEKNGVGPTSKSFVVHEKDSKE